ncbi:hypothetical protein AB0N20_27245 [Streptomyces griseoincarnatus]
MTHPALVAILVVMAGLLGAASLAIFLLYRGWKSNRALITDLNAQIAAQQIAALTGVNTPPHPAAEPARRRRHLALYIGGGVAALYTTCRDSIRRLLHTRPTLTTAAAVATVATVGTAAALVLVPGDSADTDAPAPSTASTDHPDPGPTPPPPAEEANGTDPGSGVTDSGELLAAEPSLLRTEDQTPGAQTPAPDTTPGKNTAEPPVQTPPDGSRPTAEPPAPEPDPPGPVQPPSGDTPSTGAPKQPEQPETDDDGLCVDLPPLVGLCLLNGL